MAKIKPLDDRIVIQVLEGEEKTAGGIFLPQSAKEKPQRGKVVTTGPGKLLDNGKRAKPSVRKGDVVYFARFAGTEVKVSGKEYMIMRESDLLAVEK